MGPAAGLQHRPRHARRSIELAVAAIGIGLQHAGPVPEMRLGMLATPVAGIVEDRRRRLGAGEGPRSEEHTSELRSLMRISYVAFCLKKKKIHKSTIIFTIHTY